MSNTKIIVLQRKELIYSGLFLSLVLVLLLLCILMFGQKSSQPTQQKAQYKPGVYSCQIDFNKEKLNLELVVDANHVNSLSFTNLEDSVTAMYPLLTPALKDIETQLQSNIPLDEIASSSEKKYTQTILLDSLEKVLKKAKAN